MDAACVAVCLLCGRPLGVVVGKRFIGTPSSRSVRVLLRSILLEPDSTVKPPPDWAADLQRELAGRRHRASSWPGWQAGRLPGLVLSLLELPEALAGCAPRRT